MDGSSTPLNNNHQYSAQWSRFLQRSSPATAVPPTSTSVPSTPTLSTTPAEYFPDLLQQQLSISQAQLAQFSKLISPGRTTRIQPAATPLHPVVSTPHIEAIRSESPRNRTGPSQDRSRKFSGQGGHGNKKIEQHTGTGESSVVLATMETRSDRRKNMVLSAESLSRPDLRQSSSHFSQQSNSVPSTPHQRPRQYSFDSREPSPSGGPVNHSPRSAYSESNSTLPSLRPLPARTCPFENALQFGKRRMPYNIGADMLEKATPGSVKAKLTAKDERNLTKAMQELYQEILPTPSSELNRKKFIKKLEKILNDEWPGRDIQAHMFGSSGNLLCTEDSDVDICITTPWKELEKVCKLAELLHRNGMQKVVCVSSAKVPIVKIWDPELGLACDMNVNNTLALENTRMIKTYVEIDPRVRPLAMIVKHWTRRRKINDAAFGGTLSSYTWICMIICFLQLRTPPVLPSLHQRPHQKLPAKEGGTESSFADDVESLKTFGKQNTETLGELLFHFFRYFGHEFDLETYVLSVRNGKLVSKEAKKWHQVLNNRLCVEEPFNTERNLSNTADDTSVRGLHIEIRRAFDLIAEAKLEECCEEYEYPKEEQRVWAKAPAQPKPVLAAPVPPPKRVSQRGGRSGPSRSHGNSNRRASSGTSGSALENNNTNYNFPSGLPVPTQPDQWVHAQNVQKQLHNDLYQKFSVLQAQENNLRIQLYQRSQAFAAQAHAMAHSQGGISSNGALPNQHGNENMNHGNSLDNPPLSAPPRSEYYYYPIQYTNGPPMYMAPSPSTYPSSPAMSAGAPELRRSLHRTNGNGNPSTGGGPPNGSLRSHSQPASRSGLGLSVPGQSLNGVHQSMRRPSGAAFDDYIEPGLEIDTLSLGGESPPENSIPKEYIGYYVNESQPAVRRPPVQQVGLTTNGETGGRPRRQSTDQFPQAMILDRLRRTSRSPSPLGHSRAYSGGAFSAPLASTPQFAAQSSLRSQDAQGPMIVNGSNLASLTDEYRPPLNDRAQFVEFNQEGEPDRLLQVEFKIDKDDFQQSPPVVNGSLSGPANLGMPALDGAQPSGMPAVPFTSTSSTFNTEATNGNHSSTNGNQRTPRPITSGMLPLDLTGPLELKRDDQSHLSPVYETRSPSPPATRKFDPEVKPNGTSSRLNERRPERSGLPKQPVKNGSVNSQQKQGNPTPPRVNGHTKAAKSEGGASGQWQQQVRKSKKGNSKANGGQPTSEQLPKHDNDRKGG